jgi:hypothetical protein
VNSSVTDVYIFAFLLYTIYFCDVYCVFLLYSQKNTNRKHTSGAPIGCAIDIMRGAPLLGAPRIGHLTTCATGNKYQWLDMRGAPQVRH